MKTIMTFVLGIAATAALMGQSTPEFTKDNQLVQPANYREWVFLSSGLGMTYGAVADGNRGEPAFDNVFVNAAAYKSFLQTGKWPEHTMFVLEIRNSASKASINKGGHFQADVLGMSAEVKDTARFGGNGWAFFGFGKGATGKQIPKTGACYTCHSEKGAVDNTFVQFYPTLLPVAKDKGTLSPAYVAAGY